MKFFSNSDDKFMRLAEDDEQRSMAIERLKSSRSSYYIGAMLFFAITLISELTGRHQGNGFPLLGMMFFCIAFKYESDIRTLRMVDHLRKKYETRAA
jgi:hypothetical protein